MMTIQILQIAETKDAQHKALEAEFEKRIGPFAKLEIQTLPASKSDDRKRAQEEERDRMLPKLNSQAHIIALDERGTEFTSPDFAKLIEKIRDHGPGKIQFLIGGSHGLHPDTRSASHSIIALSKMTFTHEMVRIFLKEQVYRAFTILAGKTYHK